VHARDLLNSLNCSFVIPYLACLYSNVLVIDYFKQYYFHFSVPTISPYFSIILSFVNDYLFLVYALKSSSNTLNAY
jgi:hypothetical protein